MFTFRNFSYLSEHSNLTGPYGVTFDRDTALALTLIATDASRAGALHDVEVLELHSGGVRYQPDMAVAFDALVARLVHNRRHMGSWQSLLDAVRPPSHLWTWSGSSVYHGQEAIRTVHSMRICIWRDTAVWLCCARDCCAKSKSQRHDLFSLAPHVRVTLLQLHVLLMLKILDLDAASTRCSNARPWMKSSLPNRCASARLRCSAKICHLNNPCAASCAMFARAVTTPCSTGHKSLMA